MSPIPCLLHLHICLRNQFYQSIEVCKWDWNDPDFSRGTTNCKICSFLGGFRKWKFSWSFLHEFKNFLCLFRTSEGRNGCLLRSIWVILLEVHLMVDLNNYTHTPLTSSKNQLRNTLRMGNHDERAQQKCQSFRKNLFLRE